MPKFMSLKGSFVVLGVLFAATNFALFAQSATATLSGTVTDEKGGLVPSSIVKVMNTGTGFERTVNTNENGSFVVPLLPPSTYRVTIEREGFAPFEITEVVLNANDQKAVNIRLKVGQIGESVQVLGEASLIDQSPAVGTTIDRQFVSNLPLNGRSLQALINLSPGVVVTPASSQNPGQFSVNGQRTTSNYFTVDGVSANFGTNNFAGFNPATSGAVPATNIQGSFSSLASVDAIQEFQIQTLPFAPEFGRSPGANVSIVTRSGENDYHGAVYDYVRNDIFDANDFFNNSLGFGKPPLRYNNFGGTFGGPVILPYFGEGTPPIWKGTDRTFFFFSYEGQRFTLPIGAVTTVVPSLAARAGAMTQVARDVLNAFPIPNGPEIFTTGPTGPVPTGGAVFVSPYSQPSTADAWSVRVDHKLTKNFTLFGRYNRAFGKSESRSTQALSQVNRLGTKTETITFGSTQVLTPKLVNEVRVNRSRQEGTTQQIFDGFGGGIAPPESLFFPASVMDVPRRGIITISGLAGTSGLGFTSVSVGTDELFLQRQLNIVDTVSYTAGSHQLKFGADYRRLSPVIAPAGFVDNIQFRLSDPANPNNVNILNNNIAFSVLKLTSAGYTLQFPTFSVFGQDTWKVSPRLTLTYGLRWEINPAPSATGDKDILTLAELRDPNAIDFSYLALAPAGTPVYPTKYNNFAPRIGAAYQARQKPGSELVLRGGIGVFYDLGQNGFGSIGFPYSRSQSVPNVPVPLAPEFGIFPPPNFNLGPTNRASVSAAGPDYNLPKVYQWNLTAEQSLGKNQTISLAYIAALGRGLITSNRIEMAVAPNPNNPNIPFSPNFSVITLLTNESGSDYHAFQSQFVRRLTRGLQANLGYTWSHSIDTGSQDLQRVALGRVADININRGNSDFDVRHAFTGGMTYSIPAPRWNRLSRAILGGWSVNSIFFARTGLPFEVVAEENQSATLFGTRYQRRPNLVSGVPIWIEDASVANGRRLNPAAFSFPTATQFQGDFGRNVLRGPGAWQVDLGLHRRFTLMERVGLQFRWEIFNIFNHTNFANPNFAQLFLPGNATTGVVNVNDRNFGRITRMLGRGLGGGGNDGGFNPLFQIGGPRSMQFALRLEF
jgi:hypothetical protein